MKVEIIAVGNEIITGKTVNTNATYIARQVQNAGLIPKYHTSVGDDKESIQEALTIALGRADVLLFIGGLGPTEDDLTKEVVCDYIQQPLVLYQEIWEQIQVYFGKMQKVAPLNNKKQACFPKECEIISNPNGTAPGALLQHQGKYIAFLPGPPKEFEPMVDQFIVPYFAKKAEGVYYTLDVKMYGIGESQLVELIPDLLGESQELVVAPYVGDYEVIIRIRSFGENETVAKEKAEKVEKQLKERLTQYIIGYNDKKLEESIVELLQAQHYTIATAESCTGGLLSGTLINCSGISSCYKEGFITYSNEAKHKYLGVQETTLKQYGAVSQETAREMAEGVQKAAGAHIGIATTGVAGPTGGTPTKPVGLVYVGIAIGADTYVYELHLQGNRQNIRNRTVKSALYYLYKQLNK